MATLFHTHLAVKKSIVKGISGLGLKASQPKILYYICTHEGCQQKDVAENCFLETATLSSVLPNLERKKLIRRVPDDVDKRAYKIYATEEGRKLREVIDRQLEKTMEKAFDGFSQEEIHAFWKYLDRIHKNLSETE